MATAVLLLVSLVAVQSREAAMVHVRCAEHGQLVHVESVASARIAPVPTGVAVMLPSGGATSDDEHCALVGAKHCVQLAAAAPVVSIVSATGPQLCPEPVSYTARATFRIAPKNSPPA